MEESKPALHPKLALKFGLELGLEVGLELGLEFELKLAQHVAWMSSPGLLSFPLQSFAFAEDREPNHRNPLVA